jgi:hypothetical protein
LFGKIHRGQQLEAFIYRPLILLFNSRKPLLERVMKGSGPERVKQGWQGGEVWSRGGGESTARKAQALARPLKAIE